RKHAPLHGYHVLIASLHCCRDSLPRFREGNVDEVNRCLAAGEMVDKRNTRRQTALHSACAGGHRDVADILLSQGADPAAKDDQLSSILHCAASGG
ncbi:unnamed protein product, partial [Hapterophycus canaliculatus]